MRLVYYQASSILRRRVGYNGCLRPVYAHRYSIEPPVTAENRVGLGEDEEDEDEFSARGSAGSPKLQDRISVVKPGYAESTGYLGKASTVRWIEEATEKV
jgi:hypothetical protein